MGRIKGMGALARDRAQEDRLGKSYCHVGAGIAAAGVAGSLISADSASDAADAQSASALQANALQAQQAAQLRQDLSPWVEQGKSANALLGRYLGLGLGPSAVTSSGLKTGLNPDEVRQQLLSRYTSTVANPMNSTSDPAYADAMKQDGRLGYGTVSGAGVDYTLGQNGEHIPIQKLNTAPQYVQQVDEAGLNAAIQQYYKEQADLQAKAEQDPTYGSLLTPYKNGQEFSFTGQDLQNEPGYQFGRQQGEQGINRAQASRGNFLSGAAMKELTRYNEDYAGTKFNDAYSRALSSWNTNKSAYDSNRDRIYNFLSGQSTTGQNSAAQVGAGNQQVANNMSNNLLASGAAQSAAGIAAGNNLQSGINQAVNAFNSSNNINSAAGWNKLLSSQGGGYSGYTGYVGGSDPLGNWLSTNGYTG
ncbi:hypothetical protein [Pseudacidovorax intermedius]|uniref:hypothetical protein n=1 Tax=Pseudacidovorax intermedius TaxID=433924 RepID=UPI00034B8B03|nr:hypothetical protein [Pseudacidovorax intermedius]